MAVEFNHTIVWAHDSHASTSFLAEILGLSAPKKWGPFEVVTTDNGTNVDFMVRDGKRFADSGGWGWAAFKYDAASDTFTPATLADNPPQANDAKCGFARHTIVKAKDYV